MGFDIRDDLSDYRYHLYEADNYSYLADCLRRCGAIEHADVAEEIANSEKELSELAIENIYEDLI